MVEFHLGFNRFNGRYGRGVSPDVGLLGQMYLLFDVAYVFSHVVSVRVNILAYMVDVVLRGTTRRQT